MDYESEKTDKGEEVADNGEDKNCDDCSLNGGEAFGCMAEAHWVKEND